MTFRSILGCQNLLCRSFWFGSFSLVLFAAIWVQGCGSGLPELTPGIFKSPVKVFDHGRIVEKRYYFSNGPQTIYYAILEIDGKPLRIPEGSVRATSYCEVEGIDAVGFTVRGRKPGIFVLQLDGDRQILERVCDYGRAGGWKKAIYAPPCTNHWDAEKQARIEAIPGLE